MFSHLKRIAYDRYIPFCNDFTYSYESGYYFHIEFAHIHDATNTLNRTICLWFYNMNIAAYVYSQSGNRTNQNTNNLCDCIDFIDTIGILNKMIIVKIL